MVRGDVGAVKAAVEAGNVAACNVGGGIDSCHPKTPCQRGRITAEVRVWENRRRGLSSDEKRRYDDRKGNTGNSRRGHPTDSSHQS